MVRTRGHRRKDVKTRTSEKNSASPYQKNRIGENHFGDIREENRGK